MQIYTQLLQFDVIFQDDDAMPLYLRGILAAPAQYYDRVLAELAAMGL